MMVYPLAIGGGCIIASIIGTFFVRLGNSKNIMGALYKGFIVTAIISLILLYPITSHIIGLENIFSVGDKKFYRFGFILLWCCWFSSNWINYMGYRILHRNKL